MPLEIILKVAAQKKDENIVRSGGFLACEFHENA